MEIDIITYTSAQFSALTDEQLLQVKEAQIKKNELLRALDERLQNEKEKLVENGMIHSGIWAKLEQKLREECENEVAWIRETLLFYLSYSGAEEIMQAPYTVDFSLSDSERLNIVKTYYNETYSDPQERLTAYKKDEVAMKYLGEYYAWLYDYFEDML